MARARNIKPSFFTNEQLSECSAMARLLFIGLWTLADREGRLEDRPKKIRAEVFPYETCDCEPLLEELHSRGFIVRYKSGACRCIAIPNFKKHQNPHCKEKASTIPAPCEHDTSTELHERHEKPNKNNEHQTSTVQVSENPERARLNPESPILNPESGILNEENASTLSDEAHVPEKFRTPGFRQTWGRWKRHRLEKQKPLGAIEEHGQLADLMRFDHDEAIEVVRFSINRGARNLILNGDHKAAASRDGPGHGSASPRRAKGFQGLLE